MASISNLQRNCQMVVFLDQPLPYDISTQSRQVFTHPVAVLSDPLVAVITPAFSLEKPKANDCGRPALMVTPDVTDFLGGEVMPRVTIRTMIRSFADKDTEKVWNRIPVSLRREPSTRGFLTITRAL